MPAILREKRPILEKDPTKANEVGDIAYLFARFFYRRWLDTPRWATYHKMCRMIKDPTHDAEYQKLYFMLAMLPYFMKADVQIGAEEALREFHRKVMVRYENGKYQANGEVFTNIPVEVES